MSLLTTSTKDRFLYFVRTFSVQLISGENVQVMTGRSEHTASWSYVIKNVRKIFRDKMQLEEDVKSWSLEIQNSPISTYKLSSRRNMAEIKKNSKKQAGLLLYCGYICDGIYVKAFLFLKTTKCGILHIDPLVTRQMCFCWR